MILVPFDYCKHKVQFAAVRVGAANWCFVPLMKTRGYIELIASDSLLLTLAGSYTTTADVTIAGIGTRHSGPFP